MGAYELTVAWGDCDPAGIVFYPNYLRWFDEASRRLFASAGLPWDSLFPRYDIVGLPLVAVEAEFRAPSRHGDALVIRSGIGEWRRATFVVSHTVEKAGTAVVRGRETRAWTGRDPEQPDKLRALTIPDEVKQRFALA